MSDEEHKFASLIWQEARLLDEKKFDKWIDLYSKTCLFWMPAWREDGTLTENPDEELSLIFYRGRRNLEDRIKRIRSGHSVASNVMPRTTHIVSNIEMVECSDLSACLNSAFSTFVYDVRTNRSHTFFGRYTHRLELQDGNWIISEKIIHLMNDMIPTMLDVYSV